jgi:hypothetical protein
MLTSAPALILAFFLAPILQDPERIQKLVQSLGDASKEDRDKAVEELARIGRPALEALRRATSSSDSEVKSLAGQAIERIEWAGLDPLKKYVKEHLDDGATIEPSKMKGMGKWFPDTRFYEVAGAAPAGGAAAMMGMQAPRSLFAVKMYEHGFQRLMVKGIYCSGSVRTFIQKGKIVLADEDSAIDFGLAFMELYSAGAAQNATAMMMGGASKLERTDEGWILDTSSFSAHVTFKTQKDGTLVDIIQSSTPLSMFGLGGGGDKGSEEKNRLEVEKLKLEIDLLKRQLDKK